MAIQELIEDKKYLIRIPYRDGNGRPRDRKKTINGTYKDAVIAEQELFEEVKFGIIQDLKLIDLFNAYHDSKPNVKPETKRKEVEIYNKYLINVSNYKIDVITPFVLIKARNEIENMDGSITQKNKAIYLLKSIYKFGKKVFGINNIASDIEIIKPKVKDKFVYNTLTPEEFYEVIEYEKNPTYYLLYEVYFWGGLRRGEALALFKKDLLTTGELDIYNSINSKRVLGPPKNTSSYRRVKIHGDLYEKLLPLANAKGLYLFGGIESLAPNTVNRRFKNCVNKANQNRMENNQEGFGNVRIHDLRHSHATFLASQGISIPSVSTRLGHGTISETMQTYVHLFKGDDEKAIAAIDKYQENGNNTPVIESSGILYDDIFNLIKGESLWNIESIFNEILNNLKKSVQI